MKNKYLYQHYLNQIILINNLKFRNVDTNMWKYFKKLQKVCIEKKLNPVSIIVKKININPLRFKTFFIFPDGIEIQIKGRNDIDACSTTRQRLEHLYFANYINKYYIKSKYEFCKNKITEFKLNNIILFSEEKNENEIFKNFYLKFFISESTTINSNRDNTRYGLISVSFIIALMLETKEINEFDIAKYIIENSNASKSVFDYAKSLRQVIKDNSYPKDIKENLKLSKDEIEYYINKIYQSISTLFNISLLNQNRIINVKFNELEHKSSINQIEYNNLIIQMAKNRIEDIKIRKEQASWRMSLFLRRKQDNRKRDDLNNLHLEKDNKIIEAAHIYSILRYKEQMLHEFKNQRYKNVIDLYDECWSIHNGLLLDPTIHKKFDKQESTINFGKINILENEYKLKYPLSKPSFAYQKPNVLSSLEKN